MAIEKMKKLRLLAVRDQKKALLRKLMLLGCIGGLRAGAFRAFARSLGSTSQKRAAISQSAGPTVQR